MFDESEKYANNRGEVVVIVIDMREPNAKGCCADGKYVVVAAALDEDGGTIFGL